MERILFIATSNINIKTGGGIANLALLNSLSKDYADRIDVITYEESFNNLPKPDNCYLVPPISIITKLKNFCKGRIHRFTPWLKNFIKNNGYKYTHCFINSGLLGEYIDVLHDHGIRVAVIHHNFECEFQKDNKRPSTFWGLSDYFVKRSERHSYIKGDYNLFLSFDDIDIFHSHYHKTYYSNEFPIGIFEPKHYTIVPKLTNAQLSNNKLAICGSLNSVQTVCGLSDFKHNYLPILEELYSCDYSLKIAGRNPPKDVIKWFAGNNNISIIPNPESMSDVLLDSSIFICPTNVGGGIKLRILDGLKHGMPILTHQISARGYNELHNYPWFQIYYDKETFKKGLMKIINEISSNPNLRRDILNCYKQHFSFESGDGRFRKVSREFLSEDLKV